MTGARDVRGRAVGAWCTVRVGDSDAPGAGPRSGRRERTAPVPWGLPPAAVGGPVVGNGGSGFLVGLVDGGNPCNDKHQC